MKDFNGLMFNNLRSDNMNNVKVIPCLDLNDPVGMAKYYNDAGADEVAFFDSKATKEGREADISTIRDICKNIDIPLLACGGIKTIDVYKRQALEPENCCSSIIMRCRIM